MKKWKRRSSVPTRFPADPRNTEKTLRAAIERVLQLEDRLCRCGFGQWKDGFPIGVPFRRLGYEGKLVVVTHHTGSSETGANELKQEVRARLTEGKDARW